MISFKNVNKWFGDLNVLKDINIEVAQGEVVVICAAEGDQLATGTVVLEIEEQA